MRLPGSLFSNFFVPSQVGRPTRRPKQPYLPCGRPSRRRSRFKFHIQLHSWAPMVTWMEVGVFFFKPKFCGVLKKVSFFVLELFLNHWSWGNLYIYLSICWGTLLLFGFALWNFLLWACSKKRLFASLSLLHNSSKFQDFRNSSPMILIFMANQPTPNVSFPEIRPAITFFIWFLPLWNRFF